MAHVASVNAYSRPLMYGAGLGYGAGLYGNAGLYGAGCLPGLGYSTVASGVPLVGSRVVNGGLVGGVGASVVLPTC